MTATGSTALPLLGDAKDLKDKRVLLRVDFNVPVADGAISDDFRISKTLPTIKLLESVGAKVVLISHAGKGVSLRPVFERLSKSLRLQFAAQFGGLQDSLEKMRPGGLVLFENIRNYSGEEGNDLKFAERLAKYGDIYVNEAFSVSHRRHASIVALPALLPHFAGPLFAEEITKLGEAFEPRHPALLILGGAKFETKLPLLKKFVKKYDAIYVGGGLSSDIYKSRGLSVGSSKVSDNGETASFLRTVKNLLVPEDLMVSGQNGVGQKSADKVLPGDTIVDIGPVSLNHLCSLVNKSKFVLWNGPLGIFEKGFSAGTEKLARSVAESKAQSIIGGGDTIAAAAKTHLLDKFDFVSTGGGAMLDFLGSGTLPGIEVLKSEFRGRR